MRIFHPIKQCQSVKGKKTAELLIKPPSKIRLKESRNYFQIHIRIFVRWTNNAYCILSFICNRSRYILLIQFHRSQVTLFALQKQC